MKITIGIPWRGGDEWRARSFRYVEAHVGQVYGATVLDADSGRDGPFNRSAARNILVSFAMQADVIILNDADMVAPVDAYHVMAQVAKETERLVIGYQQYRALDGPSSSAVLEGADPFSMEPIGTTEGWSVGGIIAITPAAWLNVGGMDPRFRGWGCEDFAFAHAASVVLGPNLRVETPAVHLWHERGAIDETDLKGNSELMARYTACTTVDELREVSDGHSR